MRATNFAKRAPNIFRMHINQCPPLIFVDLHDGPAKSSISSTCMNIKQFVVNRAIEASRKMNETLATYLPGHRFVDFRARILFLDCDIHDDADDRQSDVLKWRTFIAKSLQLP